MLRIPASMPTSNIHRLLHQSLDEVSDLARLEDRLADGIAVARKGLDTLLTLPTEIVAPIGKPLGELIEAVETSRILKATVRTALQEILWYLEDVETAEARPDLETARAQLETALNLSRRVADLLAAEQDIGRHRKAAMPE